MALLGGEMNKPMYLRKQLRVHGTIIGSGWALQNPGGKWKYPYAIIKLDDDREARWYPGDIEQDMPEGTRLSGFCRATRFDYKSAKTADLKDYRWQLIDVYFLKGTK
jgi:hypothetical protein